MKFYDILQKNPTDIKKLIKDADNKKDVNRFRFALIVRSILIVLFAIIFIAPLSAVFGAENSCLAVVIFCILLSVRFIDFGYCIKDSIINLGIIFIILFASPLLSYAVSPVLGFIIHLASFMTIMVIACDSPIMGNGGLFSFSYVFLTGNPVAGELAFNRFLLAIFGFIICGLIFYSKHKDKHPDVYFIDKLKNFNLSVFKHQWQLRMALGVALILTVGRIFDIERFMWAGFACGSLLADANENSKIHEKSRHRLSGVIAGCLLFYIVYLAIPEQLHYFIGPLGGLILGFCSHYRYQTAMNCFGALMLASAIYGLHGSIILRLQDTVIGIIFALVFFYIYEYIILRKYKTFS